MITLEYGIVDCKGYRIVASLPWEEDMAPTIHEAKVTPWGLVVCKPPDAEDAMYGTIGPVGAQTVHDSCLALRLDSSSAQLDFLALMCGLSIIDRADLELGDQLVVAGTNVLALAVLVTAHLQGATTVCIKLASAPAPAASEAAIDAAIEAQTGEIIDYADVDNFEDKLDAALAQTPGKRVFVDTTGQADLVYVMAARLERFGRLVLCRQEASGTVRLNIANVHHRKSAHFSYWARPTTLAQALQWRTCAVRAGRLFEQGRIQQVLPSLEPPG